MKRCVRLVAEAHTKYDRNKMKTEVFVIFPATLATELERLLEPFPLLSWREVHKSYPHLSMEDPPNFGDLCTKYVQYDSDESDIKCYSLLSWIQGKGSQLALVVYQLQFHLR